MSDGGTEAVDTRDVERGRALNELLDRRAHGEQVDMAALRAANPELAEDLGACLAVVGEVEATAGGIESLLSAGLLTPATDPRYVAELGAYKIIRMLGRGGMGIVLKAYEESLNRTVALKILRPELSGDLAVVRRFEREAKAAAALRHPNIVTVHAVGCERGVHFIAMEYIDGPSLAEVIREPSAVSRQLSAISHQPDVAADVSSAEPDGEDVAAGLRAGRPDRLQTGPTDVAADPRVGRPRRQDAGATNVAADVSSAVPSEPQAPARGLSADVIRPICRQLLSALAAAHDGGLIHRDVKSSNVLLDRCPIRAPSVSAGFLSEPRAPASGFPSVADPSLALRARINAGQPPIPNP
ncbi:MAG: protein kinase, partial [Planctomycetota bacterium]